MSLFKTLSKKIDKLAITSVEESLLDMTNDIIKVTPFRHGDLRNSYRVHANNKEIIEVDGWYRDEDLGGERQGNTRVIGKGKMQGDKIEYIASVDVEDYDVYVHEVQFKNYTTPGTDYKYLERPFMRHKSNFAKKLAKDIEEGLRK